jgi:hypothetical protein
MELLTNTPVQDDYSDVLLEVAQSLDNYSSQYLRDNIKKNVRVLLFLILLFFFFTLHNLLIYAYF